MTPIFGTMFFWIKVASRGKAVQPELPMKKILPVPDQNDEYHIQNPKFDNGTQTRNMRTSVVEIQHMKMEHTKSTTQMPKCLAPRPVDFCVAFSAVLVCVTLALLVFCFMLGMVLRFFSVVHDLFYFMPFACFYHSWGWGHRLLFSSTPSWE